MKIFLIILGIVVVIAIVTFIYMRRAVYDSPSLIDAGFDKKMQEKTKEMNEQPR